MKVYLAGPEVFLSNARVILARKAELARAAGFTPLVPGDLAIPETDGKRARGVAISRVNEGMMREADLIVANLTPFRGISADVGTVFELGFMAGLGRPVYAYSNSDRGYFERALHDYYGGASVKRPDGATAGPDGMSIEDFDMADNLMLDGGIESRGGVFVRRSVPEIERSTSLEAFEACLAIAAQRLLA